MAYLKTMNTVLVVDDDFGTREALRMTLQKNKYHILSTGKPEQVLHILGANDVDVVMLDIKMPGINGLKLLKAIKAIDSDIQTVLITAYPSTQSAIKAVQFGAYDYIVKPFDKEAIEQVVRRGVIRRNQRRLEKKLTSNLMAEIYEKYSHEQ